MDRVTISDVEANLNDIIDRASHGEEFDILRQDTVVARLSPPKTRARAAVSERFDWDGLKRFTDSLPLQTESAADLVRRMRDEGY